MDVRHATTADLPALIAIEAACFPPEEAATPEQIAARVGTFADCYWLAVEPSCAEPGGAEPSCAEPGGAGPYRAQPYGCGEIPPGGDGAAVLACIDGLCSSRRDLTDDLFVDVRLHEPDGEWLMLCGVVTRPDRRGEGVASRLMRAVLDEAARRGMRGVVLTCKEHMLAWYARFGFVSEGLSASQHGGATWYQMRLSL